MNRFNIFLLFFLALLTSSCKKVTNDQNNVVSEKKGNIDHYENFRSKKDILPRNVDVWIPEGFDENTRFQVLYMHDGQNLFNPETSYGGESWEIDVTLQKLINEQKIPPTMVVGIWNTSDRTIDYTPAIPFYYLGKTLIDSLKQMNRITGSAKSESYLSFIVEELKPFIDSIYPTISDKGHTFISGSSMGGLISLYAQVKYPNVFGGAACLSTHWPLGLDKNRDDFAKAYGKYLSETISKSDNYKLYFDYGTETLDAWYEPHQLYINKILDQVHTGPRMCVKDEGAEHNEIYWRNRFENVALFLLAQ